MTTSGQARHAFPAYRVYIFGIDVTADVLDVSVKWHTGRAPNLYSITLANPNDRYIFTTADLISIFQDDQVRAAAMKLISTEDMSIYDQAVLERVSDIRDEMKRRVLSAKITQRITGVEQPDLGGETGGPDSRLLIGDAYRYPLQAEDPIFHANDGVRIAFRDPFQPTRWYWMGAGLLSDFDDHVDENNQRLLTLVAEGTLKQLRYKRITTNPAGFIDFKAINVVEEDARQASFYQSGLAKLTLPEILFTIVFGNDPSGQVSKFRSELKGPDGIVVTKTAMRGVGNFNFDRSAVLEYGPTGGDSSITFSTVPVARVSTLAQYQSVIDHEVRETDLETMLIDGETPPDTSIWPKRRDGSLDPVAIIDYIGTRPELYPVDGGRLILLMPASLHSAVNRRILMQDIIQTAALNTEFTSRLSTICDTVERIDFTFYESPRGDLICEFPLYDFDPDDFGLEAPESQYAIKHASDTVAEIAGVDGVSTRGPFGSRYTIAKRDTFNFSKSISDEKVRTQMSCVWHPLDGYEGTGTTKEIYAPAVVLLRHLLPLYGARLEQIAPRGFIATREAALLLTQIQLNKCNADARSLGINAAPNFGVWLNRPILFRQRNCIGLLVSVDHSIRWNNGVDTRINLRYIRGWDGLLDSNGNPVYSTIGGIPSNPLNYKIMFKQLNVNSGVTTLPASVEQSPSGEEIA